MSIFAAAFVLSLVSVSCYAASAKCTIEKIEGETLVLDCGQKAEKFKAGEKIKIKSHKKQQMEGC